MIKPLHFPPYARYAKALARFEKNIRSGRFARFTEQKKWQIWNRLCRYARQLGISVKAPAAAACLAAGFSFSTAAKAQTFTLQSGAASFFNGVYFESFSTPAFVDVDNDGDLDAFVGEQSGTIRYYRNTGTSRAPVFTAQTGAANPFNGVDVGSYSFPAFVDIDNDGDKDAFMGADNDAILRYYKNTGTATAPVFTLQTDAANPLVALRSGWLSRPSFVDVDGDGDMDVFMGRFQNGVLYHKNTGTASAPVFTAQTGAANPLSGINLGNLSIPSFADLDNDGDKDAFVSSDNGAVAYYKNTGTALAPVFTLQTAANNPLNALSGSRWAAPGFVDIDGDGDTDVFVGSYESYYSTTSNFRYYKNSLITLPVHLLNFSGSSQAGYNQLTWKTAGEINTRSFELQMSSDGRNFTKVAEVAASGGSNHAYSATDHAVYGGKVFYRLKMTDTDGRFTYSQVIWLNNKQAGGISFYPNPVTDVLNINIGNANVLNTRAGLYDANARLLQDILINSSQLQIPVQRLAKGAYVIKFADGTVQRFVKKE